jgi:teichoic acid transport system permease protein
MKFIVIYNKISTDKNRGTILGSFWNFLNPLIWIFTYYIVFSYGLGIKLVSGNNYVFWMLCGVISWFFINDTLYQSTSVFRTYSDLLLKTTLTPYKLLLALNLVYFKYFLITFFILFILIFYFENKFNFTYLLLFFILLSFFVFLMSYIIAILSIFFLDIQNILRNILYLIFWATPIVWPSENIDNYFPDYIYINPFYFLISLLRSAVFGYDFIFSFVPLFFFLLVLFLIVLFLSKKINKIKDYL